MFNTQGQEAKTEFLSKSFEPGIVFAHIYGGSVRTASTGTKALELILEGPAPTSTKFEGWAIDKNDPEGPKFKGQSARVSATAYTANFNDNNINTNEILKKIVIIADHVGLRSEIDALSSNPQITSIEQWVDAAIQVLKDQNLYFFLAGKEEEYNGKTITKFSLPKFNFCAVSIDKLPKFDKNNKYHFSPLATKAVNGFDAADDFKI